MSDRPVFIPCASDNNAQAGYSKRMSIGSHGLLRFCWSLLSRKVNSMPCCA
jgi:hypothetical protein